MNPLSIIALATIAAIFGFAWHNQPARSRSIVAGDEPVTSQLSRVNWGMVVIWSFVFLSFAAFFTAGCIIWIKRHGSFTP